MFIKSAFFLINGANRFPELLASSFFVCSLFCGNRTWSKGERQCRSSVTRDHKKEKSYSLSMPSDGVTVRVEKENTRGAGERIQLMKASLFPGSCRHSAAVSPYWEAHRGPRTEWKSGNTRQCSLTRISLGDPSCVTHVWRLPKQLLCGSSRALVCLIEHVVADVSVRSPVMVVCPVYLISMQYELLVLHP